jgi:hypothetical protein
MNIQFVYVSALYSRVTTTAKKLLLASRPL